MTGIEFDHGDIYNSLDQIKKLFSQFIQKIPKEGLLTACVEAPHVSELMKRCKADVVTYGINQGEWRIRNRTVKASRQYFEIYSKDESYNCSISLLGKHNALNALGVFVLAKRLNWPVSDILLALKDF